jgi:histidinol-phosphate phosphatase family protein
VSGRRAAFLDRDGVLNELVADPDAGGVWESPLRVADVRLTHEAAGAAARLVRAGLALICVSNQPAAAKGRVSVEQLLAVHQRVVELLEQQGVHLEDSRLCLHHPDGTVPGLSGACACRKPAAGMLRDAARQGGLDLDRSWMVGDTDTDVLAGQAAGCRTVLIEYPGSAHKRNGEVTPDIPVGDFPDGVEQLIRTQLTETFA